MHWMQSGSFSGRKKSCGSISASRNGRREEKTPRRWSKSSERGSERTQTLPVQKVPEVVKVAVEVEVVEMATG